MPSFFANHVSESVNLATSEFSPYEPPHRKSQEKSWFVGARPIGPITDGISKEDLANSGQSEANRKGSADSKPQKLQPLPNGTPLSCTDKLGLAQTETDSKHASPTLHNGEHNKSTTVNGETDVSAAPAVIYQSLPPMDGMAIQPTQADSTAASRSGRGGANRRKGHARGHSSSAPQSPSRHIIDSNNMDPMQEPTRIGAVASAHRKESQSTNRFSSPPTLLRSSDTALNPASPAHPGVVRLQHRHTLEVPKLSTGRTSRDFLQPMNSRSDNASVDAGRLSPTNAGRGSLSLGRRPTRSIHSDVQLDEVPQDDEMARWTETIRQKRASRRKRKDEEEDDRVVVGTKVDMNHVNWVTAYNMLTGIRFTVSRTNAKIDRELTDGDFDARHKFSFDM